MKKVLFVATVTGHINRFHLPYLELFKKKGWKTYVATGDDIPVDNFCDQKIKVPISRSPYKINNFKAIKQLRKIIEKEHFDIIHCHTPMGGVVTRLAARKARKNGTRVIYTAHGFHFFTSAPLKNWLLFYPIEKYLAKYTDTLITINQEDYNRAKNKFSKRCHDIQYVPGVGIDPKKFDFKMTTKEKHELRASLGLKDDDFVMIFPARLDKNKNQGFLIECMPELIKDNPKVHLLLPGQDELNGKYQRQAEELGVEKNVHFLGRRDDIPQLLKISDLAVSSSKREGLPVNILEAVFSKKYTVATECRGVKDILKNQENGIVTNNYNFTNEIKKMYYHKINNSSANYKLNIFTQKQILPIISNIYFQTNSDISDNNKITVLQVLTKMDRSGAETMLMNLYRNIDRQRFRFIFAVSSTAKGHYDDEIIKLGGKIVHYPKYKIINHFIYKKWWKEYFKKNTINIVHGHIGSTAAIYLSIAKKYNITTVAHSHNAIRGISIKNIIYKLYSYPTRYIADYLSGCSTDALIDRYGKKYALNKQKSYLIKNAINLEDYNYDEASTKKLKADLKISNDQIIVGTIGRLNKQKNPFFILKIVKKLVELNNNIVFIWIGQGSLKEKIYKQIKIYNLQNSIKLLGIRSDIPTVLNALDIFILPSRYEGLPVVGIEAQATGIPIVCSDTITKELKINNNIKYIPTKDPSIWANTILQMQGVKDINCKQNIENAGYDIKIAAKRLMEFYDKIESERKR